MAEAVLPPGASSRMLPPTTEAMMRVAVSSRALVVRILHLRVVVVTFLPSYTKAVGRSLQ